MDYLDHTKEVEQRYILLIGYVLISIAILMGTIFLVSKAYGFDRSKNGAVVQNGLVYFSSHPSSATIYINGKANPDQTNTRLSLPEGTYNVRLARPGYRDWQRVIGVEGSSVRHFDYPLLIPTNLTSKVIAPLASNPGLVTQSPDRRWLLVEQPGSLTDFQLYDLKNLDKPAQLLSLPAALVTRTSATESWQVVDWADDNQHVLLQHLYGTKHEYVLVDRSAIAQSLNLNQALATNPDQLELVNKKFDQYYSYDAASRTVSKRDLHAATPAVVQPQVLAWQSYGANGFLFVTDTGAKAGEVLIKLANGSKVSTLRSLPVSSNYLLDLTQYNGKLYVAVTAGSQSAVYIYKDPLGQLAAVPKDGLIPTQVLHVPQPNYLSFSANAQFIVAENNTQFGVYDIENIAGYSYTTTQAVDGPNTHATWMDGDRLTYVSSGKLVIFDYDGRNSQTLLAAEGAYVPVFAPDFKYAYTISPGVATGQSELLQTALRTTSDL